MLEKIEKIISRGNIQTPIKKMNGERIFNHKKNKTMI